MQRRLEEGWFQLQMSRCVKHVQRILDTTKQPVFPDDASHEYTDKFALVERAGVSTLTSLLAIFEALGLDSDKLRVVKSWKDAKVTLRLVKEQTCTFLRSKEKKESVSIVSVLCKSRKAVMKTTKHYWRLESKYRLVIFRGNQPEDGLLLHEHASSIEVVNTVVPKQAPISASTNLSPEDVSLSKLLSFLFSDKDDHFRIDRSHPECLTPRRNPEVEELLDCFEQLSGWMRQLELYLKSLQMYGNNMCEDPSRLEVPVPEDLFIPVMAMFANMESEEKDAKGSKPLISTADVDKFMNEHQRQVKEELHKVAEIAIQNTEKKSTLLGVHDVELMLLAIHSQNLFLTCQACMDFIESMLHAQLREAIGREITPPLVDEYMRFHFRKLYRKDVMAPFCYDVKRPGFAPEGTLSIEVVQEGESAREITTWVREVSASSNDPLHFALSASNRVEMQGPKFVHAYLACQFHDTSVKQKLRLAARARQFSSFVLMVGRIVAKDEFEPEHAIVLQNKDSLLVPLFLEPLPTAKAFRDAIESLSPEQKDFARAIRAMQLESTLFAVAVVEIKPQLEVLLNLPKGALKKEIQLTQDLIKLFVEHQVPCDLLTYDGPEDAVPEQKLDKVRAHTDALLGMISKCKTRDLQETVMSANYDLYVAEPVRLMSAIEEQVLSSSDCLKSAGAACTSTSSSISSFMPKKKKKMKKLEDVRVKRVDGATLNSSLQAFGMDFVGVASTSAPANQETVQHQEPSRDIAKKAFQQETPDESAEVTESGSVDLLNLPAHLDARIEALDIDASLRSTKVQAGEIWTHSRFPNLISKTAVEKNLSGAELRSHKSQAMDLLDALSRSGELALVETQVHVFLASTLCFEDTVVDCVIKKNVNPISRFEHASLIVSTTVLDKHPQQLLAAAAKLSTNTLQF